MIRKLAIFVLVSIIRIIDIIILRVILNKRKHTNKILLSTAIDEIKAFVIDHRDFNYLVVIKGIDKMGHIRKMIVSPMHVLYTQDPQPIYASDIKQDVVLYDKFKVQCVYKIPNIPLLFDVMTPTHKYWWQTVLHHNTVTTSIYLMWRLMFFDNWKVMVLADKEETAEEIMRKIKLIYRYLPFHIKPGVIKNVERTMRFENESFISIQATTENTSIGFSLNTLYLDEFARIKRVDHKEFLTAVTPTLSTTGGQLVISSTPKGRNYFYDLWLQALQNPEWLYPIEVKWWQVPGRDEQWKQKQIALIGEDKFRQEYEVEFVGGEEIFFDQDSADIMHVFESEYTTKDINYNDNIITLNVHPSIRQNFENIIENNIILLSVDLAEGKGRDWSVVNIFALLSGSALERFIVDKTYTNTIINYKDHISKGKQSFVQIAYFMSNKDTIQNFATIVSDITKYISILKIDSVYNPNIIIEMNKYGLYFIELLKQKGISMGMIAKSKHSIYSKKLEYGVKITPKSKLDNFVLFRDFVKRFAIIPTDKITINQLLSFERHGDKIKATSKYDDLAMSTVNIVPVITSNNVYKMVIIDDHNHVPVQDENNDMFLDKTTTIGKIYREYMRSMNIINKRILGEE